MSLLVENLRCTSCSGHLISMDDAEKLGCRECGREFPCVWGVPFVGGFEAEDTLGLIEIAANISNRDDFGITPEVVESWETLLQSYHVAEDKARFTEEHADARSPFLANRYGEWLEVTHLTEGLDLKGLQVLDIGAGLGFDSHRLAMRGADVTALEFSPVLSEAGRKHFPHIHWVGGFSHILPFQSSVFDAVFCNAALHHMRDIPAAISEALRVLRPGGVLITTCDSFRPSGSSDDVELSLFNSDPSVLMGVNEGVPPFSDFIDTLNRHPARLRVDLFTHTLYHAPSGGHLGDLTSWRYPEDVGMLASRSGSLAMRVKLLNEWPEAARVQTGDSLSPLQYASWLSSESCAVSSLVEMMPEKYIDLPFPEIRPSKFELLNGWRLRRPGENFRTAYRRARWFLTRPENQDVLTFEISLFEWADPNDAAVKVLLDDVEVVTKELVPGMWSEISMDVSHLAAGTRFVIEMVRQCRDTSLDGAALRVRNRSFVIGRRARTGLHALAGEGAGTVYAVIPVFNRKHFTLSCVEYLRAQDYPRLKIVVSDGGSTDGTVESVRSQFPDVLVLETEQELWWAGAMAAGIDVVLSMSEHDGDFVLMMNDDTEIPEDFVLGLVSASMEFDAAVGALVVDSRDPDRVLDAGEYVCWSPYSFPIKNSMSSAETFCDDVDVLPGRGSLVPLHMIRKAGNVDNRKFPHYLADYEFFYRLKRAGCRLGVSYETRVRAHIEETGIGAELGVTSFRKVWQEAFSRRSMSNVIDHWRFVGRHAPADRKRPIQARLALRTVVNFALRTPLRPLMLPLYWFLLLPLRTVRFVQHQRRALFQMARDWKLQGNDIFCHPRGLPVCVRGVLFVLVCPGPVHDALCRHQALDPEQLVSKGVLRPTVVNGWYMLTTLTANSEGERALFRTARNPLLKLWRTVRFMRDRRRA